MKGKLLIVLMSLAAPAAIAQQGSMKGMDMNGMEKRKRRAFTTRPA